MFENLKKYFQEQSVKRIKDKICKINEQRITLRQTSPYLYSNLKKLNNTHIYPNKPKIIKQIREEGWETSANLITTTIAQAIVENVRLKPELVSKSNSPDLETKLKKRNLEFLDCSEVFWGNHDELTSFSGKFNFILNLFLDLKSDVRYKATIEKVLRNYIPYAIYSAFEKIKNDEKIPIPVYLNLEDKNQFLPDYQNSNVDIFAEAVYFFCSVDSDMTQTDMAQKIVDSFANFLYSDYKYPSKDSEKHFVIKNEIINFKNFEKALDNSLDEIFTPITHLEDFNSFGKRVYDIIVEDYKHQSSETTADIARSVEEEAHIFSSGGVMQSYISNDLFLANEQYVNQLKQLEKDQYGDIENEYFKSKVYKKYSTKYFSEKRAEQEELEEAVQKMLDRYEKAEQKMIDEHIQEMIDEEEIMDTHIQEMIAYKKSKK